ncbi:MAG: hypothetical protein NVSMB22_18520 [Chloroflexota bacterium]
MCRERVVTDLDVPKAWWRLSSPSGAKREENAGNTAKESKTPVGKARDRDNGAPGG